jgi:hypothetical protein
MRVCVLVQLKARRGNAARSRCCLSKTKHIKQIECKKLRREMRLVCPALYATSTTTHRPDCRKPVKLPSEKKQSQNPNCQFTQLLGLPKPDRPIPYYSNKPAVAQHKNKALTGLQKAITCRTNTRNGSRITCATFYSKVCLTYLLNFAIMSHKGPATGCD